MLRTCFCALWLAACGVTTLPGTGELIEVNLNSEAVGDSFLLRIRLPPDFSEDETYPLIIQLDPTFAGLRQFDTTVGLVSTFEGPEAIVVGIDYDEPSKRFRDYTLADSLSEAFDEDEGADAFYTALRDEVLPYIETTYPIDSNQRFLFGHSNASIFAWYTALRFRGERLFAGFVAADGGYPQALFTMERWLSEAVDDLPIRFLATRAYINGPPQSLPMEGLIERLTGRGYPSLVLESVEYNTDHGGSVAPSYADGLKFLLGGGQP